jgi:hypothetical protein
MCGHENNDATQVCENSGSKRFADAGCELSNFGGDELWDDDQGLM